ncbi:MAG: sensor histidine kinase, partial [Anaerolineae bacterium]
VRADETQLSIVLDHLLDNAIKYSPAGSAVTVSVGAAERQVKVSICDEGPGVSPEDLDHLFTRFYRGRQQTQTGHSLGLGLYIVRQLINAQGGEIWIESRPGAGSCFKFTIPREEMID